MGAIDDTRARALLRGALDAAVASAQPARVLAGHLPDPPRGRCVVVGAGKAAAAMAAAVEAAWPSVTLTGVVAVPRGHGVPTRRIRVVEAGHPVPDQASEAAAAAILAALMGLTRDDLALVLLSGGGSALLAAPVAGVTLADKQALTRQLLASGATIAEINAVRRRLSRLKGGRLAAAAAPARVVTLAVSDVPGDDPAVIASGPTVAAAADAPDPTQVLARYGIAASYAIAAALARTDVDTALPTCDYRLIATPFGALTAAADRARSQGVTSLILGDALEGEAAQLGTMLAGIARSVAAQGEPVSAPALLLSGGETSVTIGDWPAGRGGRNTACALGFALAAAGHPRLWALLADSDGIDGSSTAAGAFVTPTTLARAAARGIDPRAALTRHDSHALFAALGDLVETGPTLTNVNDIRAVLVA